MGKGAGERGKMEGGRRRGEGGRGKEEGEEGKFYNKLILSSVSLLLNCLLF